MIKLAIIDCHQWLSNKPDRLKEQTILDPACTWQYRKVGVDCKSLTVFIDAIGFWLNIPVKINWVIYPYDYGHVYPTFLVQGKPLIFDATHERLNRSPVGKNYVKIYSYYARN